MGFNDIQRECFIGIFDGRVLRGNHDQSLLDAYRDENSMGLWEPLAGEAPLASYGKAETGDLIRRLPSTHIEFLEARCRDYYETDDFIFVHGGIRPHVAPADEETDRLQRTTLSLAAPHLSGRTVVCGHSSQGSGRIVDLGHTICIDTGIHKGGFLTCLDLGDFSFHQVSAELERRTGRLRDEAPG